MKDNIKYIDVAIIGAGAAGLMCGIEAGKRGRKTIILDHANKVGKKILMSGGGRCNFTNLNIIPENYISHNKHFCKSALTRYTQWNFLDLVKKHRIRYHEKTLGQLFCDDKSKAIVDMLLEESREAKVNIQLEIKIHTIEQINSQHFIIQTNQGNFCCQSLVIASGGLSIPTMGASPFGYKIAEQFGLKIWPTRAGLVPLTLQPHDKEKLSTLSGIAIDTFVNHKKQNFRENSLFTHRGMSGPAILQISSYWQPGEEIIINLLPEMNALELLKNAQKITPHKQLGSILKDLLVNRLVDVFFPAEISKKTLQSFSQRALEQIATNISHWHLRPNGTEGYRTAEVTIGGVDCNAISSKTMEVQHISGLYFIGEVLDVTGWLGGYNFQWAWSSGWAAGQVV